MGERVADIAKLDALIADASASGGAERANYQLFIERLCSAFGLPGPDMAREENSLNDYVFERRIDFKHPDGTNEFRIHRLLSKALLRAGGQAVSKT